MFDWNEDELSEIIWTEDNGSDYHIVPYPKGSGESKIHTDEGFSKKQQSQKASHIVHSQEDGAYEDKNDSLKSKMESNSYFNPNEDLSAPGLDLDSWLADPSNRDSIGNNGPSDFPAVCSLDSVEDDTGLFGNVYEVKEGGGFLDCSWANIVNFENLDTIFRNNDYVLGNEYIDHADELLSSANLDATPSSAYPIAASSLVRDVVANGSTSELLISSKEFKLNKSQSRIHGYNEFKGAGELKSEPLDAKTASTETTADTSQLQGNRSIYWQQGGKISRGERQQSKTGEKEEKPFPNLCSAWPSTSNQYQQFCEVKSYGNTNSIHQRFPSSVCSFLGQHDGPESLRYQHESSPFKSMAYGYPTGHFPVDLVSSNHSEWEQIQMVNCSPDYLTIVNLPKENEDSPSKRSAMTTREKIEKLRRRQKIQAMFAIQQQKQQLEHEVTITDKSVYHKSLQENEAQCVGVFPSQELKLLSEEDSSKIIAINEDSTMEETIFNQLQDAIEKLDFKTRISIRDSLFRLAKNSTRRHNMSYMNEENKRCNDDVLFSEETSSGDRCMRFSDVETDTNHKDRIVAHLLFHVPTKKPRRFSEDAYANSPMFGKPVKQPLLQKMGNGLNSPTRCFSESSTMQQSDLQTQCSSLPEPQQEIKVLNQSFWS